tara:strand:+ start:150 stop:293 length:144 start_codon:yes stop_codon:yes gene_type:complete
MVLKFPVGRVKESGFKILEISELTIHKEAVFIITYNNENNNETKRVP